MNTPCQIYFIGAGPGDPGLITVQGQEIIQKANLVLYAGSLVPREVVAGAKAGAQVVDSAGLTLAQTHALIMATVHSGGLVARVHTGDPSLYGTIAEQSALLRAEKVNFAIIPGVTSAMATAAKALVSFTVPEKTQSLIITRMSGRTPMPDQESLAALASHQTSMAIYLSAGKTNALVQELRQAGLDEQTTIIVGHKVGHAQEQILRTTLDALEETMATHGFSRQTMFLILPGEKEAPSPSKLYAPFFGHDFRKAKRPPTWSKLAIYAMTTQGLKLARRMTSMAPADLFAPVRLATRDVQGFQKLADQVRDNFEHYHGHVFIAATGIVVRCLAPVLHNKSTDPAVVVCDQNGQHVISLLSGHVGGANALAKRLADHLGARAVITTATDTAGRPALDLVVQQAQCVLANPDLLPPINTLLAEGNPVKIYDPHHWLGLDDQEDAWTLVDQEHQAQVRVTSSTQGPGLIVHPPSVVAGIGCRRGCSRHEILQALHQVMEAQALAPASLYLLASVDLKAQEQGLLDAAHYLGLEITFVERELLATMDVPNPSAMVREKIGVASVCEAAALIMAQKTMPQARLLVPKTIVGPVTIALAGL